MTKKVEMVVTKKVVAVTKKVEMVVTKTVAAVVTEQR